jgi:hypothetical protein
MPRQLLLEWHLLPNSGSLPWLISLFRRMLNPNPEFEYYPPPIRTIDSLPILIDSPNSIRAWIIGIRRNNLLWLRQRRPL